MIKKLLIAAVIVFIADVAQNAYKGSFIATKSDEVVGYVDESGAVHNMCNDNNRPLLTDEDNDVIKKQDNIDNIIDDKGYFIAPQEIRAYSKEHSDCYISYTDVAGETAYMCNGSQVVGPNESSKSCKKDCILSYCFNPDVCYDKEKHYNYDCLLQQTEQHQLSTVKSCLLKNRKWYENWRKHVAEGKAYESVITKQDDGIKQCLYFYDTPFTEEDFVYNADEYVVGYVEKNWNNKTVIHKIKWTDEAMLIGEIIGNRINGCAHFDSAGRVIMNEDFKCDWEFETPVEYIGQVVDTPKNNIRNCYNKKRSKFIRADKNNGVIDLNGKVIVPRKTTADFPATARSECDHCGIITGTHTNTGDEAFVFADWDVRVGTADGDGIVYDEDHRAIGKLNDEGMAVDVDGNIIGVVAHNVFCDNLEKKPRCNADNKWCQDYYKKNCAKQ